MSPPQSQETWRGGAGAGTALHVITTMYMTATRH